MTDSSSDERRIEIFRELANRNLATFKDTNTLLHVVDWIFRLEKENAALRPAKAYHDAMMSLANNPDVNTLSPDRIAENERLRVAFDEAFMDQPWAMGEESLIRQLDGAIKGVRA